MLGLLGYGVYYRRKEKLPFDDEASIIPAVVSSVAAALTIATLGIPTIEVMGIYFLNGNSTVAYVDGHGRLLSTGLPSSDFEHIVFGNILGVLVLIIGELIVYTKAIRRK